MPLQDAFPILHTDDVERLAAFYCDELGFERGYRFPPDGPAAFLVVKLGTFELGVTRASQRGEAGRTDLWFYTDDVDAEVARLREHGARIIAEPVDREWGERMATIADPDGNVLHIGSRAG